MGRYAEGTTVNVEQTKTEIERTLRRFEAKTFVTGWDEDRGLAMVQFQMNGRRIKFVLPMPDPESREFLVTPKTNTWRSDSGARNEYEKEVRRRWRALLLVLKAKLESVESEIESFDEAFMPHIVLPDGSTVAEFMVPQIEHSYQTQKMPPLLAFGGDSRKQLESS